MWVHSRRSRLRRIGANSRPANGHYAHASPFAETMHTVEAQIVLTALEEEQVRNRVDGRKHDDEVVRASRYHLLAIS